MRGKKIYDNVFTKDFIKKRILCYNSHINDYLKDNVLT